MINIHGRQYRTSGTATRARPNPVIPLTTLPKKMMPEMTNNVRIVITLLLINRYFPELFLKEADLTIPA
jgi:hypothetical protein